MLFNRCMNNMPASYLNSHIIKLILQSAACRNGNVHSTKDIIAWLKNLNETTYVNISETSLDKDSFWFYDDRKGEILNRKRSFFSITGMRYFIDDSFINEQPIIFQNEIGFLGIIVKVIDGVLNFLMQAKIEPGNINCVQLSPTIQATKSNFTRAHGGRLPYYFEWFEHAEETGTVLYDQIQSEQGSRFYGKRNRNIIILIEKDIEIHPNYKWMTLGQIKELMKIDNLVNMDTRTVLSGIPMLPARFALSSELIEIRKLFSDETISNSILSSSLSDVTSALTAINNYKMHHNVASISTPLNQLVNWEIDAKGITSRIPADFSVRHYNIEIQGREMQKWSQPLFKACSSGIFVLFTTIINGIRKFLLTLQPEIGCFDKVELGPTIQVPNSMRVPKDNEFYPIFEKYRHQRKNVLKDVFLSEEGGRFYHETNRNIILEVNYDDVKEVPGGILIDYASLSVLMLCNNCLNIQLRNLLSLLDF